MLHHTIAQVNLITALILATFNLGFIPTWVTQILLLLGSSITGFLTKYGWDGIEKLLPVFAKIPSLIKPFITGSLAIGIGMLGTALNTPLPTDVHLWTNGTFSLLAGAVFAWLMHAIQKAQAAKAAGVVVAAPTP